jgi:uncharacterized protein (DUF2141 family)
MKLKQVFANALGMMTIGQFMIASKADAIVSGNLTITIEGLRHQRGQICLNLFSGSGGFPSRSDRALQAECVSIQNGSPTVTFRNLKTGSYAISVIHDANKDGTLNRNGLGIPTEGFGFSRNPRILTGPPKYSEAAIVVAGSTNIQIRLQYFLG